MDAEDFEISYCRACLVSASDEWIDMSGLLGGPGSTEAAAEPVRYSSVIQLLHPDAVPDSLRSSQSQVLTDSPFCRCGRAMISPTFCALNAPTS